MKNPKITNTQKIRIIENYIFLRDYLKRKEIVEKISSHLKISVNLISHEIGKYNANKTLVLESKINDRNTIPRQ